MTVQVGGLSELGLDPQQVMDFYRKHWARPIALADEAFFHWQFRDAPYSGGKNHCVVALKDGGLVGVMGCTPWLFHLEGRDYPAAQLTTWVVSEDARGLGIGQRILDYLCGQYDVLFGSGITPAALPLYTRQGFRYFAHIPRYSKILDYALASPYVEIHPAYLKRFETLRLPDSAPMPTADGRGAVLPFRAHGYKRDESFLQWRYRDHPYYRYHWVSHAGFTLVYRLQPLPETCCLHVVDILGEGDITPALYHLEAIAAHERAAFIDYMQVHAAHQAALRHAGWLSAVDDYYARVMHLFSPPEMRTPPTTSFVFWGKGDSVHAALCHLESLYFTKADLDVDRPTMDALR